MKEYAVLIICTSALIALGTAISYKEGDKTLKGVFSLMLICTVLMPIVPVLSELSDTRIPEFTQKPYGEGSYTELAADAFERGVRDAICERFDLERDCVSVKVGEFNFEKMSCGKMTVKLSGKGLLADITRLEEYLSKNFDAEDIAIELW